MLYLDYKGHKIIKQFKCYGLGNYIDSAWCGFSLGEYGYFLGGRLGVYLAYCAGWNRCLDGYAKQKRRSFQQQMRLWKAGLSRV